MELPHDDDGLLVVVEPIYLWFTERDARPLFRLGRRYPKSYGFTPEVWRCHDHPDWQGEDIPESRIKDWEADGTFSDRPGGPRGYWEAESVQAHADLHATT